MNFEYPPLGGGGGLVNAWLAEELAKRHETTVLTSRAFDLPAREVVRGVEIVRTRTLFRTCKPAANLPSMATFILGGTFRGGRLVRKREFDVINTHFALPSGPVGHALSAIANVPNVLSLHGGDLYDPSKWSSPHRHVLTRSVVRKVARSADAVVGQSRDTTEHLHEFYDAGIQPELIPLGIPRPPIASANRAALGLAEDDLVLVTVGRLVARKRVDQLLGLVHDLRDARVRLIVIGDGPRAEELRRLAGELGVADRIRFAGFVSDQEKTDLLAAADIYVSTSQHEGFGLVFLEAMAQGLPVVCYDNGGQTDYLRSGINGAVIGLNDIEGFRTAVRNLVADRDMRNRISARNRSDVERYFIENCADRYEELFQRVQNQTYYRPLRARQSN